MTIKDLTNMSPKRKIFNALVLFLFIGFIINFITNSQQNAIIEQRIQLAEQTRERVSKLETQVKELRLKVGLPEESVK